MSKERRELDSRIKALANGREAGERFILIALGMAMPTEAIDQAFEEAGLGGRSPVELTEHVAGKPFHHWIGKTREDVERELTANPPPVVGDEDAKDVDEHLADVQEAFASNNMRFMSQAEVNSEVREQAFGHEEAEEVPQRDDGGNAGGGGGGGGSNITESTINDAGGKVQTSNAGPTGIQEPTYGENQTPLSEVYMLSDKELLAMNGIGQKTIEKIRADANARGLK